jgi:LacI family transcriptional regulator
LVTLKEVAKIAGVSTATVSRVVNEQAKVGKKCRERVKKIIEEVGYRPNFIAKSLADKSSNTIGIVTPNLSMSFFSSLACGSEHAARENGYSLVMRNSLYETKSELDAIKSLRDHNCQSIILHSEYSDEQMLIKLAKEIPGLVFINRFIPELAERCVWLDNQAASQTATQYLISKGHKDIAVITSVYQNRDPATRVQGVQVAMMQNSLKLNPNLIAESTANMEGGEQAVKALLSSKEKFTAIVAYNDLMAIGAIHALFNAGLNVPKDVSVFGFDDLDVSRACRPKLTTMHYPIEEMAAYATNLAVRLVNEPEKNFSNTHLFMANLVERDSVADLS